MTRRYLTYLAAATATGALATAATGLAIALADWQRAGRRARRTAAAHGRDTR